MTDIDVAEHNPCAEDPCPACGARIRATRIVDINMAFCRTLGLDPKDIRSITIEVRPDNPPLVTVQHRGQNLLGDEWNNEVSTNWHLVPVDEPAQVIPGESGPEWVEPSRP